MSAPRLVRLDKKTLGWIGGTDTESTCRVISRDPLQLAPIAWGKPDPDLARGLHQHIADATGPIVIPFDRRTHPRLRRALRSLGIHH